MKRFFIGVFLVISGAIWTVINIVSNMSNEIDAYEKYCAALDKREEYSSEESTKIVMKHKRSVSSILTDELEFFKN